MNLKYKILISLVLLIVAFAGGRYSATSTTINSTEQEKIADTKNQNAETHTTTVTIITEKPNGEKQTTITEKQDTDTKTVENNHENINTVTTEQVNIHKTTNVSVLVMTKSLTAIPTYGLSVTHEILGPVTAGLFATSDGTIGVSAGVSF